MSYLVTLSIGPVQDFIAAARRTSDLTAGSTLLTEIVGAAAGAIEGELIFPVNPERGGANKILAIVPDTPGERAEKAKASARKALLALWKQAAEDRWTRPYRVDQDLAWLQVNAFLEIYAAWEPLGGDYESARRNVDRLLSARKNLRNFEPAPQRADRSKPDGMWAKSPLDPAWEPVVTTMPTPKTDSESDADYKERNPLYLKKTEFLDAVSLLKRKRGMDETRRRDKVPSTRDLAAHVKPDQWTGAGDDDETQPPYAYYAILQADGDKMGEQIGNKTSKEEHQAFSKQLDQFATSAHEIVKTHDGCCVYAGGDDVLALLPVKTVVECAQELNEAFRDAVRTGLQDKVEGCTLSAGIAVVHYLQPLYLSLEQARDAERTAKKEGRDRLCLSIHTRGGNPLNVVRQWDLPAANKSDPSDSVTWANFEQWTTAYRVGNLTRGVAYELRKLASEFKNLALDDVLPAEAQRIWKRKKADHGDPPPIPAGEVSNPDKLDGFADLLVAARFLTSAGKEDN